MKFSDSIAIVLLSMPLLVLSAPTANTLERRAGVTCTKKYEGDLYVSNETTEQDGSVVSLEDNGAKLLIAPGQASAQPIRFQFDECTTDGWNAAPREFGQLKPVPLADQVQCVTAAEAGDVNGFYPLSVQACGDFNGGVLDRQWFYANYHSTNKFGDVVTVSLTGNPNDADTTYDLEAVYAGASDGQGSPLSAVQLKGAHIQTFSLRNVQVVS